jgi:hypothetical protein
MVEEVIAASNFLKDYATLIAIPAAAIVGSITYRWQKNVDRKSALIELRLKAYTNYLDALFNLIVKINPENNMSYNLKLMELSAVASDEVVRKVGNIRQIFKESGSGPGSIDKEQSKKLIGEAVLSMRKDCFETSDLTIPEIIDVTPIR